MSEGQDIPEQEIIEFSTIIEKKEGNGRYNLLLSLSIRTHGQTHSFKKHQPVQTVYPLGIEYLDMN